MTRAALTKLLILVILAFIICLPEFFSLHRVSKVNFLCLPYRPCEQANQVRKGERGKIGAAESKRKDMCEPSQAEEWEKLGQACAQWNQSAVTDPASGSRRGSDDAEKSWFVCQTDMDMEELHSNISSSATYLEVLEVSVELLLNGTENLNLTLYGKSNHSSLHLHPPEDQEEEEDTNKGDEGQEAFYRCVPALPASESTNQSCCLLWIANQTVATAEAELPWKPTQKDEWRCMLRLLWLVLLLVVLLTIVTAVLREINFGKCPFEKPTVHPIHNFTGQQLNDGEKLTEIVTPQGMVFHFYRPRAWSELSPIEEADCQEDTETLLDGNVDHCYTANLHHRCHPSTSLTEEKPGERSTEMDLKEKIKTTTSPLHLEQSH